ncbi:MAG: calcium/sodium antiporter [Pararhodobacter sp.]|nr:calcium/sodium antiporter [Pararhodobacter sp.]
MLLDLVLVAGGLALLVAAGDVLVRGAVNLSLRLGIPAVIVGLTVVSFGTSAPELFVSVGAVLAGVPALALGNVIGSNIANVLLVLGIPALIGAIAVDRGLTRDLWIMIAASVLFIALAFTGAFVWWHGLVLLAGLGWMLFDCYARARHAQVENGRAAAAAAAATDPAALEGADDSISGWRIALFLVLGLIGLPIGAQFLVTGSVNIATVLGVSEAVIGLTLVAVGTSLPELATTAMAAWRREAGVALGNVLGSNVFNLLGIIGVAAFFGTIPVPPEMLRFDLWVMLGTSVLLGAFILTGRAITRFWGVVLIVFYALYVLSLFGMSTGGG